MKFYGCLGAGQANWTTTVAIGNGVAEDGHYETCCMTEHITYSSQKSAKAFHSDLEMFIISH
jgi:hypothetical protein